MLNFHVVTTLLLRRIVAELESGRIALFSGGNRTYNSSRQPWRVTGTKKQRRPNLRK
jgi:hypothetical protein